MLFECDGNPWQGDFRSLTTTMPDETKKGMEAEPEKGGCAEYVYEPLDSNEHVREFRLLKLLPAKNLTDDIRCEQFHSPDSEFEALSYVWGDANITVPILLHGILHPVTSNLELAFLGSGETGSVGTNFTSWLREATSCRISGCRELVPL